MKSRSAPVSAVSKSYSPPPKFSLSTSPEAENPELARYLNRNYWQQQSTEFSNASAPSQQAPKQQTTLVQAFPTQNGVEDEEMEDFINSLSSNVEMFVNRMKSNSSRGRSISNDTSVQTLFLNITTMHSKLLRYIQQQDDSRVYYEGLQDKLTQVKDARAALDALREEHREKIRREAELAEKQRQMQMAQKLDIMRKKKQEYLAYQRQLALQRIQDQEREMQLRQEQQKQQYMMGTYSTLPYMQQGGYPNDGMVPGRFPGPPPPQHNFPPYNPSSVPVEQLMAQQMMNMRGGPMVVGTEHGMMGPSGPRPMMGGPNMGGPNVGLAMAPPQGPHHPQGPPQGHPMGQNQGMPPHGRPMGPPQMGQPGHPIAPPMGPSPQHSGPHMGPMPSQPGAPPMGPQPGAPPMAQPGAPPMGPPSLQGPPNNMGMGPPPNMMQQGLPPHQQVDIHQVKEEEKTAELISFD